MKSETIYRMTVGRDSDAVYDQNSILRLKHEVRFWLLQNDKRATVAELYENVIVEMRDADAALLFKLRWG